MININTNFKAVEVLRNYEKQEEKNPNFYRIFGELRFLSSLSASLGGKYDALITDTAKKLAASIAEKHCATPEAVTEAESALASLEAEAKSFEYLCIAHAHIDMNWMWGYDETVSVTLATMETMLAMMDEFPAFTFSQSQASVYKIIEEFAPAMFGKIKQRVKEGRWEVLASTWVETDKNMPSGESLSRHLLYTKDYFEKNFGIPKDSLVIDFEPDTFGHNLNVPEICASGGVKYYYHCRGRLGETVASRWRSPSGKELLIYTEPWWYNGDADTSAALYAPELSRLTGSKKLLRVYGVGDHGGGPTRRDISRFIAMNEWPLYPKFTFGRLKDYFENLEKSREKLPVINGEINFLCDGCYTTQTRIKAGNRKAERLMAEAEFYSGAALFWADHPYPGKLLADAWRKILFNQFHDIIPGSGVTETREYASGLYQQVFAAAESARTLALEAVADKINLEKFFPAGEGGKKENTAESWGEGAGVGYGQTARAAGKRRAFHVFNSLPYDREEVTALTVWDYEGSIADAALADSDGRALPLQKGDSGDYWGHHFDTLITRVKVPSSGFVTVILDEKPDYTPKTFFTNDMRVQSPDLFILENEYLKARLDPRDGSIASLVDKETGAELAPEGGGFGIFRFATEAHHKGITGWNGGMSAWFTGRFKGTEEITKGIEIRPLTQGALRTAWELSAPFGTGSSLKVTVSLDAGSPFLCYEVICDWREFGSEKGIPNLHFHLPLTYKPEYLFDVPFGMTEREGRDMDLPAESFVLARNAGDGKSGKSSLALFSLDKYGFRCNEDSLALTLIRGSTDPDPTPETGRHRIRFALCAEKSAGNDRAELAKLSLVYRHFLTVISGRGRTGASAAGTLPLSGSFMSLSGGILSAVKQGEKGGNTLVFRMYEAEGKETKVELRLAFPAESAFVTDVTEEKHLAEASVSGDGKTVSFTLEPWSVRALLVNLR
ncbi:alpha-mannosidase [Spirochaetia bacterium]|nr:alpha-mannosidase [Spirochaetia bacterium]